MATRARPLSPHLQIYRWQISNTLSIMHRLTGVILAVGFAVLTAWLMAIATGSDAYATIMKLLKGPLGVLLLTGWTAAFFFHFFNGLRHLFWDAGLGFEKHRSRLTGWLSLAGTALLTAVVVVWIYK